MTADMLQNIDEIICESRLLHGMDIGRADGVWDIVDGVQYRIILRKYYRRINIW
jgi:hypothetical protein